MDKTSKIYVAGHRGLVGSAIVRGLETAGYTNIVKRTHVELDLSNEAAVADFFKTEKPDYVFLAAAKVGGILANNSYPAEFIRDNLAIQTNIIHHSWKSNVRRLLFLGSSCIYPKDCPQPIKEEYLLTGPLEPTNRPYALAKIAGIEMCWAYNRQYGTQYLSVMPTNLYGPGDNYDLEKSHVLPALIRKMHEAKTRGDKEVVVWGTGKPMRELLYSEDMADACIYVMNLPDHEYRKFFSEEQAPLINIGTGEDVTIAELAATAAKVVGFDGELTYDTNKPDGTMRKVLDVSKINSYGWKARTTLEDGINKAYQEWLSRD
ncbi:MAG: GDP-L-fucose synthase [Gammaproteobacteria bacterium]|nr:GDP-L-fucose synthase [Gammaproteobacteria bacterium]